ncbi:MAG: PQQ-binding-like beta-propeller repeat protein [bacterium]
MNFLKYFLAVLITITLIIPCASEDWLQFKFDNRNSGDVPGRSVKTPLGLLGAIPLTDAVFTAPVISDGFVYVVDGSGLAHCIEISTMTVKWTHRPRGGNANCNNTSSPAIIDNYLHYGTMSGAYYVLNKTTGELVKEIQTGDPIFTSPVVDSGRVYFASLGMRVYALEPNGETAWTLDYVKEKIANVSSDDRWDGMGKAQGASLSSILCARDILVHQKKIILPSGPYTTIVGIEDMGTSGKVFWENKTRRNTFAISMNEMGLIYRQWTILDNESSVDFFGIGNMLDYPPSVVGTSTNTSCDRTLGFSSVSPRGLDVYRCAPQDSFGFCRHSGGKIQKLGGFPSISSPILLDNVGVYGALDGKLYVVPLSGSGNIWSFKTAFDEPITAPAAVCDGKIFFGCEDGYLYILGEGGNASLPAKDLEVWKIRGALSSSYSDPKYNWYSTFSNFANTNSTTLDQDVKTPFKLKWIRRYDGSIKHHPVSCGGGRMYTHTSEGQIFAVEQETGRQLWRRYWPGVTVSYTGPGYYQEKVLVPQGGKKQSMVRCLNAANGDLIWEAKISGSPCWNREQPPVCYKNLAIYMYGTGNYTSDWLCYDKPLYAKTDKPMICAWDIETGDTVWLKDFSDIGHGGDNAGLILMGDTLYYSAFFGTINSPVVPMGLTAAMNPMTGDTFWTTTKYSNRGGGTTLSGRDGRIYLAGRNSPYGGEGNAQVVCLDAKNGSFIWESAKMNSAIYAPTIGSDFILIHSQKSQAYVIDIGTGRTRFNFAGSYHCMPFAVTTGYMFACNLDAFEGTANSTKIVFSAGRIDPSQCASPIISNGRLFYTGHGGGMQLSFVSGQEASNHSYAWEPSGIRGNLSQSMINYASLKKSYPNPFRSSVKIPFNIGYSVPDYQSRDISIRIYDVQSRLVRELKPRPQSSGENFLIWDGCDQNHRRAPSGIYYYQLAVDNRIMGIKEGVLLK